MTFRWPRLIARLRAFMFGGRLFVAHGRDYMWLERMVPLEGIEPPTLALRMPCSTPKLQRQLLAANSVANVVEVRTYVNDTSITNKKPISCLLS